MSKDSVTDWDTDPDNNLDIAGISIAEGCAMANLNNAIRLVMAQIKEANYFSSSLGGAIPVGGYVAFGGTAAPALWVFAYGQNVSRTTYAALFAVYGTTYGAGDGSTTFTLPDLRGRTVAGKDDMGGSSANRLTNQTGGLNGDTLGATGGSETHVLTVAQLAAHTHPVTGKDDIGGGGNNIISFGGGPVSTEGSTTTGQSGSDEAHNNVQPTIIANYIIYAGA